MNKIEKIAGKSIGVFDSGLGGLTVVRSIRQRLPNENIVFLGDIARVPYGTRSPETVRRYAINCANHLSQLNIKMIVVACNTVSAVALDLLSDEFKIPILGVIEPGAMVGVQVKRGSKIGVIATRGTVASGAYKHAIQKLDPRAEVVMNPAPLLVPLAEEGWINCEVASEIVRHYLEPLVEESIDTLILGCTHYPLFKRVIQEQIKILSSESIVVVDSAQATAVELDLTLKRYGLSGSPSQNGELKILLTDLPDKFHEVASQFLGESVHLEDIEQVDIDYLPN